MKRIITIILLISTINLANSQEIKYINASELNVREGAGTSFSVITKVSENEKVTILSEQGKWSEIETENGTKGFVSTKFLSISPSEDNNNSKGNDSILKILVIGFLLWLTYKGRNIIYAIFGSSKGSSSSTPKQKTVYKSSNSAVYRFRVKGNGSSGGVKYVDGMNIEVAVTGIGANTPFNNIVEKLFVQEFARKYNVEPRFHSSIKTLFRRERLDVERM